MPKTRTPQGVVGERSFSRGRYTVRSTGDVRSEDAGMSSDNGGEIPPHR
jgi:hypothetical protein